MAANKFCDLKMTEDFNNFWAEFQVLASELDYSKSMLISKLKYKLTSSLSWAMTDSVSQPENIYKYTKQYQQAYQDLKDIDWWTLTTNPAGNQYNWGTNTNISISTSTNVNAKMANQSKRSANSVYCRLFSVALNVTMVTCHACSKATKLIKKEIVKL